MPTEHQRDVADTVQVPEQLTEGLAEQPVSQAMWIWSSFASTLEDALAGIGPHASSIYHFVNDTAIPALAFAGLKLGSAAEEYASRLADVDCVGSYSDVEWWKGVAAMEAASLAGIVTSRGQCESVVNVASIVAQIDTSGTLPLNSCTCKAVFGDAKAQGTTTPPQRGWHPWVKLGGTITDAPAAASLANGDHWVMARTSDGLLWEIDSYNGGTWTGWYSTQLSVPAGGWTAVMGPNDSYLKVLMRNGSSPVAMTWDWSSGWRGPLYLGTTPITDRPYALQVGANTEIWETVNNTVMMATWAGTSASSVSTFSAKSGPGFYASGPSVTALGNERITAVVQNGYIKLHHTFPTAGWQTLPGNVLGPVATIVHRAGIHDYLDVFARGTDGRLWQTGLYRETAVGGVFSTHPDYPWKPHGTLQIGSAPVTTNAVDPVTKQLLRRSVFVRGADGALYVHEWR